MKSKDHTNKHTSGSLFSKKGLLALLSGIIISVSAVAGNSGEKPVMIETAAGSASRIIREQVKFPDFTICRTGEERVNVVFTVDEAGQVNLVVANTANQALRKAIETQFLTLNLGQLKANNAYSIQFNFKTL